MAADHSDPYLKHLQSQPHHGNTILPHNGHALLSPWLILHAYSGRSAFTRMSHKLPVACPSTALDSLDGASVTSVLKGSTVVSPRLLPRSRVSCYSPQVPCVSGAPGQVSHDEVPIPCLRVSPPPPRCSARAAAALPAERDDEVPIYFSPTVLLWFHVLVMPRFISCGQAFLVLTLPLPQLLFALNLPGRQAAAAMPSRVCLIPVCFFFCLNRS
jgi:hypothetical protein